MANGGRLTASKDGFLSDICKKDDISRVIKYLQVFPGGYFVN